MALSFEEFYRMMQTNPDAAMEALDKEKREATHAHKCPSPDCGLIWTHAASDATNQEEHDALHRCPMCGKEEYEKWSIEHGMFTRDAEKLTCQ